MKKRALIIFPNKANWAAISTAVPILAGIGKKRGWTMDYFDTFNYEKELDSNAEKELTGGMKPGLIKMDLKLVPRSKIIPDLQEKIDGFKPDLIAVNVMSHEFEFLMEWYPEIKVPDNVITIIGGVHPTIRPEEVVQSGFFDIVCVGEGESVFDVVLEALENGGDITNIQGTHYKNRGNGQIVRNGRRKLLDEAELWSVETDYSYFDDRYFVYPFDGKSVRKTGVEISRGCPYDCKYCGNSALRMANDGLGKNVKLRPMGSIFRHLKRMVDEFKIELFYLGDECFLAHPKTWLEEFAERYREIKIPFIFQTRPETVKEDKIEILKNAGAPFFQASIGVEAGSERILFDVCNRKTKRESIIKAFDILHNHKIRVSAFFMVGFPYETREEIFDSINLCRRIKPDVMSVAIFQPLPGQELTDLCIKEGFMTGKEPLVTFTERSILTQPQISASEIKNLWRTFVLYATLPEKYFPDIKKCEDDYKSNKALFDELIALRWELASREQS